MISPSDSRQFGARPVAQRRESPSELGDLDTASTSSFDSDQQQQQQQRLQQQPSVDSLLIAYSPPNATIHELASLNLGAYQPPPLPSHAAAQVSYAKVRPEPINERSIVDSVVGFFHDVVGSDAHSKHSHPLGHHHAGAKHRIASSNSSHLLSNASTSAISEIKEQIEWIHFESFANLDSYLNRSNHPSKAGASAAAASSHTSIPSSFYSNNNSSLLLVIGYKTGFSIWTIDLNGVATEALSIKEPNITHAKLLKIESSHRLLMAICKLIINDANLPGPGAPPPPPPSANAGSSNDDLSSELSGSSNLSSQSSSSLSSQQCQTQQQISILNLLTGECLHEITFNGEVLEMKSNAHLLCVNSWNRIDAFDLETFEHRFSVNSCYSQISKSSGQQTNPFAIGDRWLAFADNKFHSILSSQGGVSMDIEQSYTATVLNTAKNISKGLAKISESVVNSVVSKSKTAASSAGAHNGGHSPRLAGANGKLRHDSKDDYQPGICTIVDTKKFVNNSKTPCNLYDENQNWIVAHFLAHQEAIYALEFNPSGRLLCSADCLGQYFNVFQINSNPYKSTRTFVKHLYSLYRGDTSSKVKNIAFSSDSRWLAISTKRGTTHIFPINCYGGAVNARTHSKPYVVNRTSKHQRTAGFIDPEDLPYMGGVSGGCATGSALEGQQTHDSMTPLIINNNPKLKSLLEPLIIPAYGQLKQPNANSSFQSSIISTNAMTNSNSNGLLTSVASQSGGGGGGGAEHGSPNGSGSASSSTSTSGAGAATAGASAGSTLAASALSSAATVTENVTSFGLKNFSLLATNTSNMIQYDNVCAVAIFGDSRGYLSPEEPRDFALNRLKPAPSLFVISDVNGNLVEYQLDVVVDTSKAPNNKPTNDSPVLLKLTPKAQWPLQRFIASDELRYPIHPDNPLLCNSIVTQAVLRKHSANHGSSGGDGQAASPAGVKTYSPSGLYSNSPTASLLPATVGQVPGGGAAAKSSDEWIKLIEVNTHMGPHRRLFMGPQFVFKTFNSNLSTTLLNAGSSSVMSDAPETPIIDLAGDIELNSLDISLGTTADSLRRYSQRTGGHATTSPMQINTFNRMGSGRQKFDSTPTYIEVGAGSFQEGMPILCGASSTGSRGSQKSLNSFTANGAASCGNGNPNSGLDLLGDNLIESLADAMNESHGINTPSSVSSSGAGSMHHSPLLAPVSLMQTTSAAATGLGMSNGAASAGSKHRSQHKTHFQPLQPLQANSHPMAMATTASVAAPSSLKSTTASSSSTPTQAIAISSNSSKIKKTMANKEDNANLLLMHANSASPSLTVGSYLLINNGGMSGVASALSAANAGPAVNTCSSSNNSCTSSSSSSGANSNEDDNLSSSASSEARLAELGKLRHHGNGMTSKHMHHNHHHNGHDDVLESFSDATSQQQRYRTRHLASIENLELDDEPNLLH